MNSAIFAGAVVAFALTTWLVRSPVTVSGIDYMQAMIPHHSIAILTSVRPMPYCGAETASRPATAGFTSAATITVLVTSDHRLAAAAGASRPTPAH